MPSDKEPKPPKTPPEERITVRMGEWREGQSDVILETRNLGPCIGIAIYEPQTKRGFLGHIPLPQDAHSEYVRLEDHLRSAFDEQGSFSRMKAWLSGGSSALIPDKENFLQENRDFMTMALTDIGIPEESVKVSWTPEGFLSTNMTLDCSTGTCQIDFIEAK